VALGRQASSSKGTHVRAPALLGRAWGVQHNETLHGASTHLAVVVLQGVVACLGHADECAMYVCAHEWQPPICRTPYSLSTAWACKVVQC
jgi:hypothetical protein